MTSDTARYCQQLKTKLLNSDDYLICDNLL
jgi:hypothetical protein